MTSHPLAELRPGDRVRDYEVEGVLGQGGFGRVYKAYHPRLRRRAAIKVMSARPEPQTLARFEREAQAVAALKHPAILTVFDFGELDGEPFMVLEFMPNGSLAERLDEQPLPPAEVVALLAPIADALDHAHRQGVVHRDVKPGNVFLDANHQPVLADFGLSRLSTAESITVSGSISGTPAYIAPEMAEGGDPTPASDVYALTVMAYQLLTGELPFRSDAGPLAVLYQHISRPPPRASEANPALPAEVDGVLARGMAKRPEDRWPTARAMVRGLADALAIPSPPPVLGSAADSRPRLAPAARARPLRAGWVRAAALAALSVVAVVVLVAVLRQAATPPAAAASPGTSAAPAAHPGTVAVGSAQLSQGGPVHVTGSGFDAALEVEVFVQQGNVNAPIADPFRPNADGSFSIDGTVSRQLAPGAATLRACSVEGPQKPIDATCASVPVTVSA